jgi:hypothetical protein
MKKSLPCSVEVKIMWDFTFTSLLSEKIYLLKIFKSLCRYTHILIIQVYTLLKTYLIVNSR